MSTDIRPPAPVPGTRAPAPRLTGGVCENPVTGEHVVILEGPEDNGGERILAVLTVRPGGAVAGEHTHAHFSERFGVLEGELAVRVDGREMVRRTGGDVVVAPGVRHDWWNAGDAPARVLVEITPPGRFSEMILTLFALARDGLTDARGRPGPLQAALLAREFATEIAFTTPPRWIQRPLFAVLAPIARARGLQPTRAYGPLPRVEPGELERLRARARDTFAWAELEVATRGDAPGGVPRGRARARG